MPLNESGIYTLGMQCMDLSDCSAGPDFVFYSEGIGWVCRTSYTSIVYISQS